MKQNLLMILICLFGISNVNAQFSAIPFNTNVQFRAATDGLIYFGYCDDNIITKVGVGETAQLSAAIRVSASTLNLYAGKKISSIRIGLAANSTNVSVWIRSSLNGSDIVSRTVGNVNLGWTEVTLPTPFTIPDTDFYIGYTATGYFHVGFSGNPVADGCWLWYDGWGNYVDEDWGSLCIQAGIDPEGTTVLSMGPEDMQKIIKSAPNQNLNVPITVKSYSSVDVTSLKVAYQIDNQPAIEWNTSVSIAPMKSGIINIPVNAISSSGIYQLSVKILEVNGQPNDLVNKSLISELRIISQSFPRKVVMEEGTGTWCGWCPRGFVGMAMMKQNYPESFIGIAVHNGDPMTVTEYDNYMVPNFFYIGFPSAVINRKKELVCDPHPEYGVEDFFNSEMTNSPIAGIKLSGGFADTDKKAISLKTVTTFGVSSDNANFKLAYVLIENGITGYAQENYYAGGGYGAMGGFENRPSSIANMVFDDVARGIYSSPTGIPGSIPASITDMAPVEHTYNINLPSSIKDVDKLEVVVMLLHATTGEIENADMIAINEVFTDLSITTPDAGNKIYFNNQNLCIESGVSETVDIYAVNGVKIYTVTKTPGLTSVPCGNLPDGIMIVKGSSGWVKKVVKF